MADNADLAQELIDRRMEAALQLLKQAANQGAYLVITDCEDCGDPIPAARRERLPGVATCVECQSIRERRARHAR